MLLRRKGLIAAVILGLVIPGIGWAVTSQSHTRSGPVQLGSGKPVRFSPATGKLMRPDNFIRPDAILSHIVARYGGSTVIDAYFGGPTPGWTGTEDPSTPLPEELRDGRWLYMTVDAPATGSPSVRPLWEANLVAGALMDELRLAGVPGDLIASNVSLRLPDGQVVKNLGGGMGNVEFGQFFSEADDRTIKARIRTTARELGLQVQSVDVLHPLQPAPAIVVTTSSPQEFVENAHAIYRKLFGGIATFEAEYLEARDLAGDTVFIQANDFRTGVGSWWIRPDLDSRQGRTFR